MGLYDREFLARYTNAANWSTWMRRMMNMACSCAQRCPRKKAVSTRKTSCGGIAFTATAVITHAEGADPFRCWRIQAGPMGTPVKPSFQLLQEARKRLHARLGCQNHRHTRIYHPPPGL